jgi:hypothetical protein
MADEPKPSLFERVFGKPIYIIETSEKTQVNPLATTIKGLVDSGKINRTCIVGFSEKAKRISFRTVRVK